MWIYDMYKQIQMVILYQKTVLNVVLMLVDIKIKWVLNLVRWNHLIRIWELKIPPQTTQILDLKYLVHDHAPNQMLKYSLL